LNHASLIVGLRCSGAVIRVFRHNDAASLEKVLKQAIIEGQPRTRRPWKKIVIVVEGVYSMEGEVCALPQIVAVKKKYKAYLYVDEAHSIGAMGRTGRGVCEYWGVSPADVDMLMGTFTKSFGSVGGYISGSKEVVAYIRATSYANLYDTSMAPGCVEQIIASMKIIMGEDGTDEGRKRLDRLRNNSNFFRSKLKEMGCQVLGDADSPIVPLMIYHPAKMPAFSRMCLQQNIAVVVVGYPAVPLTMSRARFCISAAHEHKDLEAAIEKIRSISQACLLQYPGR